MWKFRVFDAAMKRLEKTLDMREIDRQLDAVGILIEQLVKRVMPVLTGAARASWKYIREFMEITLWGLDYIKYLNQGHSKQAPSGFIDVIVDRVVQAALRGNNGDNA